MDIAYSRLEQLIKAENDANMLKAFIADKYENYGMVTRDDLGVLYSLFIGKKEEE